MENYTKTKILEDLIIKQANLLRDQLLTLAELKSTHQTALEAARINLNWAEMSLATEREKVSVITESRDYWRESKMVSVKNLKTLLGFEQKLTSSLVLQLNAVTA